MTMLDQFKNIHQVPSGQRIWVVRADGGFFLRHFVEFGTIAIGHLDEIDIYPTGRKPFAPDPLMLETTLTRQFVSNQKSKGQLTSAINQVRSFIYGMRVGDLVMTPASNRILIGRIVGVPTLDANPLVVRSKQETDVRLKYRLRRKVIWGPDITRTLFPISITKSMRANQTVFNVDEHWIEIHHLMYPIFFRDQTTFLSFRIGQPDAIDSLSVSRFLLFLSRTDAFSGHISKFSEWGPNASAQLDGIVESIDPNDLVNIQAQFMSPGDLFARFSEIAKSIGPEGKEAKKTAKRMIYATAIYAALFGNDILGVDGIIDLQTRQKIWNYVLEEWKDADGEKVQKNLKLSMPNPDTKKIETPKNDEKGIERDLYEIYWKELFVDI